MAFEGVRLHSPTPPRAGQVVLPSVEEALAPADQVQILYRLSDPALSELGLDDFLDELLNRVREALSVDTVAILLFDRATNQLVARAAKGIEEEVEQGVRIPVGRGFAGRIAAERVAIYIADVDHADILNPILREKGIQSLLGTPLVVEGDLIGVLHVGSLRPREFDQRDLAILQVAAARAAPGIERARLYSALEHEHRVAVLLQRSLLPKRLAGIAGVSAAARYLPATDEVGGDWYDVFELPGGRVGIAIGDVVGHGLRAAALMGQLRTALHAYALEDHGPGQTLSLVDRFIQAMPEAAMATAAYAVLDAESGELRMASAGHMPPVIIGAGKGRAIELPPCPPLGAVPFANFVEQDAVLAAGEMLVLYTDGLIERPGIALGDGVNTLLSLLGGARTAEGACRLAVERLVPAQGLRDDCAIVVAQNELVPSELDLRLAADSHVLSEMRRTLRRWLRTRGADDRTTSEVTMAVNEAAANAIEHAYSPAPAEFMLRATQSNGEVVVSVIDGGQWRSPRGRNRGRGLIIMDAAMDRVDVRTTQGGTEIIMRKRFP